MYKIIKFLLTSFLINSSSSIKNHESRYSVVQNSNINKESIIINRICYSIEDFNQRKSLINTGYHSLEEAIQNSVLKSNGDFGTLKTLIYNGKKSAVKIQIFENFDMDDLEFWASNNELRNLYLINEEIKKNEKNEIYVGVFTRAMVMNLYDCVYDNENKMIFFFIDELYDTFKNQKENFLKQNSYERYFIFRIMIYDIRKLHKQMKKVHLDIKPDNIMFKRSLVLEKHNDDEDMNRSKFIDYGLMSDIGSKVRVFNKDYAHPDLINESVDIAKPYLDIFSLLLTFAEMEYGFAHIKTYPECYEKFNYTEDCFSVLKRNIILGHCLKLKDDKEKENCGEDLMEYINNYVPPAKCTDLACFIYKTLLFDGNQMQERLDLESDNTKDSITVKDLNPVLDACPDNIFNILANIINEKREEDKRNGIETYFII